MNPAAAVAPLLLALAFLVPLHELPWTGFHGDLFAAAALLIWVWRTEPGRWPWPALAVLALSLVPLIQHAAGLIQFRGDAVLASLYLAGLAFAIQLGAQDRWRGAGGPTHLGLALLVAALVSALLALANAAGLLESGALLGPTSRDGRAVANLAQPNLLATLLVLGLISLLALWPEHARARGAAWLAGALLMGTLAVTVSRSGLLQALLVLGLCTLSPGRIGTRASRQELLGLTGVLLTAVFLREANLASGAAATEGWLRGESVGNRFAYARLFAEAIWASPWVGYGFNQVSVAQARQLQLTPGPTEWAEHSHNLALDMLLWGGLPLGGLMLLGLLWVAGQGWRRAWREPALAPAALGVAVLLVHALLEFPLDYFIFLLPFGLFIGQLAQCTPGWTFPLGRLPAALLAVTVIAVVLEYRQVAPALAREREATLRPMALADDIPPSWSLLDQLQAQRQAARYLRLGAASGLPLSRVETISQRYAIPMLLHRLTEDARRQGDTAIEERLRKRLAGPPSRLPPQG